MSSAQAKPFLVETELITVPDGMNMAARALNLALVSGICVLLAFAPLAFGAVQEWSIAVLEAGTALLVVIWAGREMAKSRFQIAWSPLYIPALLFGGIVVAQLLFRQSAYEYATWFQAFLWAAYGMLFFLAGQTFRRTRWLKVFAWAITAYGAVVALFAVVQSLSSDGLSVYWLVPVHSGGFIYGPYINHSHYAGLMELLVPIPLVLALSQCYRRTYRLIFGSVAVVMASTIFLSQSIGGICALLVQLAGVAIVIARNKRGRRTLLILLGSACLALMVTVAALWPAGLKERMAGMLDPMHRGDLGIRVAILKDSLLLNDSQRSRGLTHSLAGEHPLLGWGLGTFPVVYPPYRTFYSNLIVNEAHNDYLQTLVETGAAGLAVMIAFLVLLFRRSAAHIAHWRHELRSSVVVGAMIGCIGLLVHGLYDFNLQIPANAALFFVLAAIASGGEALKTPRKRRK